MKKSISVFVLLLVSLCSFAQVGINTTSPYAQLDIRSSNQATPVATDGILVPKVDVFPTGVDANQDAMLVYLTTTVGTDAPGFYYYNHATTTWLSFGGSGAEKIDDLSDGRSDSSGTSVFLGVNAGQNDDGTFNENIGVGQSALSSLTSGSQNVSIGNGSGSSVSTGSNNVFLGYYAGFAEGGSNKLYIESSTSTPLIYGEFDNDFLQINGTLDINGAYQFPSFSGSTNQVLAYNGFGQMTWLSLSDLDDDSIDNLSDGKTDTNASSIFLGTAAGYNDDDSINRNIGIGPFSLSDNTSGEDNVALGNRALHSNISGNSNIALGNNALNMNTIGLNNIALGTSALQNNVDGHGNIAIGQFSQSSNSDGLYNTSVGAGSSRFNVTGNNNTAIGTDALRFNTRNNNTAVGSQALKNADGTDNVAIGYNAAFSQIGAVWNIAIGSSALYSNTESVANIAIGHEALYTNTGNINDQNVAIGHHALRNANASHNIAIGSNAMISNTGIGANVAIGSNALNTNIVGGANVVIGHSAGVANNGSYNIFLGVGSGGNETGSNKLYIESSNADANNALVYGEFDNDLLRINGRTEITGTTDASASSGSGVLEIANSLRIDGDEIVTNTNANLFLQNDNNGDVIVDGGTFRFDSSTNRVGVNTNTPDYTLSVRGQTNLNEGLTGVALSVNGDEALWYNGTYFSYGFGGTANYFADNVGIGITNPGTKLQIDNGSDASLADGSGYFVIGNESGINIAMDNNEILARNNAVNSTLYIQTEGGFTSFGGNMYLNGTLLHSSDRRLKKDITKLSYGLDEILKLRPVEYFWKHKDQDQKSLGLIAQEVDAVISNIVQVGDNNDKTLTVSYTELIPVLIRAIQEQENKIETLESKLEYYKSLEARIEALESYKSN